MRILIIDDHTEWALALAEMVDQLGHTLTGIVNSLSQTGELLKTQSVDIIIGDVMVRDGSTVTFLQAAPYAHCPVLFATACTDGLVYELATRRKATRYLIKPFHPLTLRSAIESVTPTPAVAEEKKGITVRAPNGQRVLVAFDTVYYICVERNYCFLFAQYKKYALKISLAKLMQQLDGRFVQIHKGFCINADYITRTDFPGNQIVVNDESIPIGYLYRKRLVDFLAEKAG